MFIAGAAVAIAAGGWWYLQVRRSPAYSLRRLAAAVDAKDRLAVAMYLDVHQTPVAVTAEMVNAAIAEATRNAQRQRAFEAMGTLLRIRMLEGMKPMVVSMWV